ncbi:MAG: LysR family transcriptional regulator [Verrucomicrobiaceae bacterium]
MYNSNAIPFDLRSLELFLVVCDQGTMAAAARVAGLTQPAVSQAVAEIEERAKIKLFDRSVRPLGLTPAGAILRQRANALIADARQIAPLLRETRHGNIPLLRVGYVDSLCRAFVPELAAHLATVSDRVSLVWGLTASHADAILTRRLDIFVGVDDIELLEGLEKWSLIEEPYVLITPANAPDIRSLDDLTAYSKEVPFIRYSQRTKVGREIERHCRRLALDLPSTQEFDIPFAVTAAVANGNGWAFSTPLCIYESAIPAERIRVVPMPGGKLRRKLTLIGRKKELGNLTASIAQFCRAVLAEKCIPAITQMFPWLDGEIKVDRAVGGGTNGKRSIQR